MSWLRILSHSGCASGNVKAAYYLILITKHPPQSPKLRKAKWKQVGPLYWAEPCRVFSHCELSSAAVAVSGKRRSVHPAPAQEPGQPRDKIQLGFWQRAGKTWEKTGSRSPLTPPLDPWERNDTQFQLWDLKKFARTSFCAKNKTDLYVNSQFQHFRGNCWKSGKNGSRNAKPGWAAAWGEECNDSLRSW